MACAGPHPNPQTKFWEGAAKGGGGGLFLARSTPLSRWAIWVRSLDTLDICAALEEKLPVQPA